MPFDEAKTIHQMLVKLLHPDGASPEEQLRRTRLMQRVNVAYDKHDLETLRTIAAEVLSGAPSSPPNDDEEQKRQHAEQEARQRREAEAARVRTEAERQRQAEEQKEQAEREAAAAAQERRRQAEAEAVRQRQDEVDRERQAVWEADQRRQTEIRQAETADVSLRALFHHEPMDEMTQEQFEIWVKRFDRAHPILRSVKRGYQKLAGIDPNS